MTEASHQMASNPLPPRPRKPGTVGIAAGPEVAHHGRRRRPCCRPGEIGEVVIRGPNVTPGYENNPEANAEAFTRRLVPHRRPGRARRRRLPHHHRPAQGDHQPRRREDLAARGRRVLHGPSGGGAGRHLRACRTTSWARRWRRPSCCARAQAATSGSCATSRPRSSPTSRCRARSSSWPRSRRARPASCSASAWPRSWASRSMKRSAIFGAGAIGGLLGARLAAGGVEVSAHRARAASRGDRASAASTLLEGGARAHAPGRGAPTIRPSSGRRTTCILTLKAHSVAGGVRRRCAPLLGPDTAVVDRQSTACPGGTSTACPAPGRDRRLETVDPGGAHLGRHRAARASSAASSIRRPRWWRRASSSTIDGDRFTLGEPIGRARPRASSALSRALIEAGLKAPVRPRIRDEIWVKLWGNLAFNPISALTARDARADRRRSRHARRSRAP